MAHKTKALLNNILVIAPHPDDETLGCGGTLLRHASRGDRIHWLIVTGMHRRQGFSAAQIARRRAEIRAVSRGYGFASVTQLNLPAARLDTVPMQNLIGAIGAVIVAISPSTLYVPAACDIHSDHRVVYDASISCTKWFRHPSVRKVLLYEVPSETDVPHRTTDPFRPNSYADISEHLAEKLRIMSLYRSEVGEHPFPRSTANLQALATVRGASAGVPFAEAFMVYKELW